MGPRGCAMGPRECAMGPRACAMGPLVCVRLQKGDDGGELVDDGVKNYAPLVEASCG